MNIQLLSDLHLENNPGFTPQHAPGADLLVLAGDIGSYQRRRDGSTMPDPDWGLRRFADWPVPVVYVPGNHEYDGLDWDDTHARLREACERLGLIWLEREVHVAGGVRLIGTTLWSDYDVFGDRPKAYRAANHYLRKMEGRRNGQLFDAEAMRGVALECQQWLRDALLQPWAGSTVVVTHFAPTLHSMDPRYGATPGTAGFCNGLDDLLPQADLWLHGHLHCPTDVQVGRCRIKANPLGYADKNEQAAFQPAALIEVQPQARNPHGS